MSAPVKVIVGGKADYAKHRGCSPAYVSKLIRLGKLAEPALMADGRVNFVLADQMVGRSMEDEAQPGLLNQIGPVYAVERARREAAQAELAEMELAERRAQYIRRDVIYEAANSAYGLVRAQFSEAWAAAAVDLAAMTDAAAIADYLAALQERIMGNINKEFLEHAARRSAG